MGRNPTDQYEYWESLKKSFNREFMEKARERYKVNRKPDLWDRLDDGIRKSLKDDAEITVSGKRADKELAENFVMGGSNMCINFSVESLDEVLKLFIEFDFDDGDGEYIDYTDMYYTTGDDDGSYGSVMNGISRAVDYFRERTRLGQGDIPDSFNKVLHGFVDERDSHSWIDACDSVARNAVTSVRDGYLHERRNSMDVVAENKADDDTFNDSRLFSSDDDRFIVRMTFLDSGPEPHVLFDMYETGVHMPDDDSIWSMRFKHKVLSFIDDEGFSFTSKVLLTINDFINSSETEKG